MKYHNHKTMVCDILFDSKAEAKRWQELLLLERAGEITDLKRQVRYELLPFQKGENRNERKCEYVADFTYIDNGKLIVEDAKGMTTKDYIIKRKLMLYIHKISIREVYK